MTSRTRSPRRQDVRPSASFASRAARLVVAVVAASSFGGVACKSLQSAAGRDPMRCERDPDCQRKRGNAADCVTQCVDNPACIDRCASVTGQR